VARVNAKCPFGFGGESESQEENSDQHRKLQSINYPSDYFTCPKEPVLTTQFMTSEDYKQVVDEIIAQYDAVPDVITDNHNLRGQYAACLVRLAGHDFMDFRREDANMGGSDGCVKFDDPTHKGLIECLQQFDINQTY